MRLLLEQYFPQAKKEIEKCLTRILEEMKESPLYPKVHHALASKGKRLRPILAVLAGEAVGGSREKLLPAALAVELIHTASLIHDDVIDGDLERRGEPALHVQYGGEAILAGDLLFAKALQMVSGYGFEMVRVLVESSLELCEGEALDISLGLEASIEEVLFKIKLKSAALFRAAAHCGGLAGGGGSREIEVLKVYGEKLGMAYQLADDLREIERGDLEKGRLTLPYLHLYRHGESEVRRLLEESFGRGSLNPSKRRKILEALNFHGSLHYCRKILEGFLKDALESLKGLRNPAYRRLLEDFAYLCVEAESFKVGED
ncbi:MAG: hypothetical protein DRO46_02565 [Candidatus Hecatellales archaeon]|nr:MAG: hypothetical protein DRO46_02565 [Candidatus Hecatellales archaeon]